MSLRLDVSRVRDYETVCSSERSDGQRVMNPVTNALMWATMIIGWEEITEQNYIEWYTRLRSWEIVAGSLLYEFDDEDKRRDRYITLKDVHQHVGLRTNASKITSAAFAKKLWTRLEERVASELKGEQV